MLAELFLLLVSLLTLGVVYAQSAYDSDAPVVTDPNTDVSGLSDEAVELKAVEAANPTPFAALPAAGTYWSARHAPGTAAPWPPLPGDIYGVAAWPLGDGNVYLLNDLHVDDAAQNRMRTLAVGLPPFPGGTNDPGTNGLPLPHYSYPPVDYGSNLFIAQWSLSNNVITGIASNTLPGVIYQLQAINSLPPGNWVDVGDPIIGSATTNWTPLNPVTVDFTTNELFRLRSNLQPHG